jgi:hypothetical protein
MGDGHGKAASELHLNTSCCMETGINFVDGESPAAAAKLRPGPCFVGYYDFNS